MTRLAVIADVHGDVEALRDALVQIDRLDCDLIVCAGDLVGLGPSPEETIALLRERGIPCVAGNHDRWAIAAGSPPEESDSKNLPRDAHRFLRGLPRIWRQTLDGVRVVVVHGSIRDEMDGIFPDVITGQQLRQRLDGAEADVLVVGHTHEPFRLAAPGGGIVVNPGALFRRPLDEPQTIKVFDTRQDRFVEVPRSPGGTFGVLELPSRKFVVRRAEDGAVVKIVRAGKA